MLTFEGAPVQGTDMIVEKLVVSFLFLFTLEYVLKYIDIVSSFPKSGS